MVTEIALSSSGNSRADIWADKKQPDLWYSNDAVRLSEDPGKLKISLDHLNNSIGIFMGILHLQSEKMQLKECTSSYSGEGSEWTR